MEPLARRSQLIRQEARRLREFLASLPPKALSLPSACEQWQVGDAVAHIIFGLEHWYDSISRALKEDTTPNKAFSWPGSRYPTEENAADAIARRRQLGENLLPTFFRWIDRLDELLGQMGPEDWNRSVWHRSDGIMPLHTYFNSMIRTFSIHGWDIRSAIDPDAGLSTQCIPDLVEHINKWLTLCFQPASRLAKPVRYRFQLTGAVASSRDVVIEGDTFREEVGAASQADVTFHCDAVTFVLMMYGRRRREEALARGQLKIVGDSELAAQLDRWFKPV